MSLRIIHLFFIVASTLLSFGLAAWGWSQGEEQRVLTGVCGVAGVGLVGYGIWFLRNKFNKLN